MSACPFLLRARPTSSSWATRRASTPKSERPAPQSVRHTFLSQRALLCRKADTWTGSNKQKAIAAQTAAVAKGRKPLQVVNFKDFLSRTGLADDPYKTTLEMNEVEELLITAHFKKESKKGYKPPGKERTRTHLMGMSYVHTDHEGEAPA